ncbi:MAG TPA: GHMP kinase, partial [Bacteroidia bacterium]|nr:GHMP kinase [Bacteroidia bacterium]
LQDKKPVWREVDFRPPFHQNIHFVHLGKKQNSRKGIHRFEQNRRLNIDCIDNINGITKMSLECKDWKEFCNLAERHETIISEELQLPKVKDLYFSDFDGSIKSLGAWGGDFVMAVSHLPFVDIKNYFEAKGYTTIVTYNEMIRS